MSRQMKYFMKTTIGITIMLVGFILILSFLDARLLIGIALMVTGGSIFMFALIKE